LKRCCTEHASRRWIRRPIWVAVQQFLMVEEISFAILIDSSPSLFFIYFYRRLMYSKYDWCIVNNYFIIIFFILINTLWFLFFIFFNLDLLILIAFFFSYFFYWRFISFQFNHSFLICIYKIFWFGSSTFNFLFFSFAFL